MPPCHPWRTGTASSLSLCFLCCLSVISSPYQNDLKEKEIISSYHLCLESSSKLNRTHSPCLKGPHLTLPCFALSLSAALPLSCYSSDIPSLLPCFSLTFLLRDAFSLSLQTVFLTSSGLCSREEGLPWPPQARSPALFPFFLLPHCIYRWPLPQTSIYILYTKDY